MVNHFITRLANIRGEHIPRTANIWDVYIPEYQPVTMPSNVAAADSALFSGAVGDARKKIAYWLVYNVYNSDLKDEMTKHDTRITYTFPNSFIRDTSHISPVTVVAKLPALNSLPDSFFEDSSLIKYFRESNTFVDRLAAVTVAYQNRIKP
jgi:hypothetical protein